MFRSVPSVALLLLALVASPGRALGSGHEGEGADPYPLDQLPILSRVMWAVRDDYFDRSRVDPRRMALAALEAVEASVPEVIVHEGAEPGEIRLTVGAAERLLRISRVDDLRAVRPFLSEALSFVQEHLASRADPRDIERAAVNGMLSTLDPNTTLLTPKQVKEIRLAGRRRVGGAGLVLAIREGRLTVTKVLRDSPAERGGVRRLDVITAVDGRSTRSVELERVVGWLRGDPGSRMTLDLVRPGGGARRIDLTREEVRVQNVAVSTLLEDRVAYVKLAQFSARAARDLANELARLRAHVGGELRGLVLDLRGNPGGLLEEGARVADLFLSSGVIVKVVGGQARRIYEVKEAGDDPSDIRELPLVVVVDHVSAGASEIVAGALKDGNRAVIVGRRTFGQGLIHVLHDFGEGTMTEGPLLKLAIAQYWRPSGIPFAKGIAPDVLLAPRCIGSDTSRCGAPPAAASAGPPGREEPAERSAWEVRYLVDENPKDPSAVDAQDQRDGGDDPDDPARDYEIRLARDLLARTPSAGRSALLEAAGTLARERGTDEEAKLAARLAAQGIDWSSGPTSGTPRATLTVSPPPGTHVRAGDAFPFIVTVENRGDGALRRLHGWTRGEPSSLVAGRELMLGTVPPGERRSWTVRVRVPVGMVSHREEVLVALESDEGSVPELRTSFDVVGRAKPAFAVNATVDDGNDGLLERGEEARLRVDVRNGGKGASGDTTHVVLEDLGGDELFITKGYERIGVIPPGEVRSAELAFRVERKAGAGRVRLRVTVVDEEMGERIPDDVEVELAEGTIARSQAGGAVRVRVPAALVRSGASATAVPVAAAVKGATLPVRARYGGFYEVAWASARSGFVAAGDVERRSTGSLRGTVDELWHREQPRIALRSDAKPEPLLADGARWSIEGVVSLPPTKLGAGHLRDVRVLANGRKVLFTTPERDGATRIEFSGEVPLRPGNNEVTVIAREDDDAQTSRTVEVFRP